MGGLSPLHAGEFDGKQLTRRFRSQLRVPGRVQGSSKTSRETFFSGIILLSVAVFQQNSGVSGLLRNPNSCFLVSFPTSYLVKTCRNWQDGTA
ncbi:hypothetical protein AMTR_s00090p00157700 [Amborella trichopoda]|uniref:Uncharacterized protein n=1 Tax=Amborella trichopoda TaxID=13333 RepID=W1P1A9_AMBTC|nr:hypothetical protein AMTR_s00090p00157700 [Amborella trichopoda]